MLWFGSSAGVAVANLFPEAKSVGQWLRHGWFIPIGYVAGFFVLLALLGWHPHEKVKDGTPPSAVVEMLDARSAGGAATPPAPDSPAK